MVISLIAMLATACSRPPAIVDLSLSQNPNDTVPLAHLVSVSTDRPATVTFSIADAQRSWNVDPRMPAMTEQLVPILGLKPDRTHTVHIHVTDEAGRTTISEPLEITTEVLPEEFPKFEVRVSQPDLMEPGYTLFEPTDVALGGANRGDYWLIAVDASGEVVWFYHPSHSISDAQRLANGNFLYRSGSASVYEIDMLGNVITSWRSDRTPAGSFSPDSVHVATDTLHHEVAEMPSGNLMALSTEVRQYDNYWSSETDPDAPRAARGVVGDVIVEFTRDGRIVREISLLDVIDPYRIGYGALTTPIWRSTYPDDADAADWSHANGISVNEAGDSILVSLRRQSAVIKFDLATNEPVWILGDHTGWGDAWQSLLLEPVGEFMWAADQHAPMYTPLGNILLFDNGSHRAWPFDPPMPPAQSFSRAVEYRIDENAGSVEQVWSFGSSGEDRHYGWRVGDADWMPETGNVLITYGSMARDANGNFGHGPAFHQWLRIVEVTHENPAEIVFELIVDDDTPREWLSFQAERLPDLYP